MTPESEKLLMDKVNNIHLLLAGSEYDKSVGLVNRFEKIEKYIEGDKKFKQKVAGGVAVGTPVLVAICEYIKHKLGF